MWRKGLQEVMRGYGRPAESGDRGVEALGVDRPEPPLRGRSNRPYDSLGVGGEGEGPIPESAVRQPPCRRPEVGGGHGFGSECSDFTAEERSGIRHGERKV